MTFRSARREVAGAVRRLRRPRLPWSPASSCKRYNLEVLAKVFRGTGRRPVLRPARNPRQDIRVRRRGTGQWSSATPRALPGPAVRANSRRLAPGRFSRVRVKIIRGASGFEFLFINARVGSIGQALNIASCGNAHGSFDVRSLSKKAGKRLAAVAFRGDHAILAWFLPFDARPRTQALQGGFVAAIGTEPVVVDGRTCL
jgi:hypothetical protein